MPKGDRLKFKADPEDGTTPIANLLLEAVAMAKLSGQEKGAILRLWRETYGWVDTDKKRRKECKFTLSEWGKALDITRYRASDILAGLVTKNIFSRRTADQWGGYYYKLNTDIASWNSNTINLSKLAETAKIVDFGDVTPKDTVTVDDTVIPQTTVTPKDTVTEKPNSYEKRHLTVTADDTPQLQRTTHPTLYKEILNKVKEIYSVWNEQKIVTHKKITDDIEGEAKKALKDYTAQEIEQAIRSYAEIVKGEEYYFKYRWTLKDFLKRGLGKFLDLEIAKGNYLKGKNSGTRRGNTKSASTQDLKDSVGRPLT